MSKKIKGYQNNRLKLFKFIIVFMLFISLIMLISLPLIIRLHWFNLQSVEEWFALNGPYYGGVIGALFTGVIVYLIASYQISSHHVVKIIEKHKPFFTLERITHYYKNNYDIILVSKGKNLDRHEKIRDLEVFLAKDEHDVAEFKERAANIEKYVELKMAQLELQKEEERLRPYINNRETRDMELAMAQCSFNAYNEKNRNNYLTLYFRLENIGNHSGKNIEFFNVYINKECIVAGEDLPILMHIKALEYTYFKLTFIKDKIKNNLSFKIRFKDVLNNLYEQDVKVGNISLPKVEISPPIRIKDKPKKTSQP